MDKNTAIVEITKVGPDNYSIHMQDPFDSDVWYSFSGPKALCHEYVGNVLFSPITIARLKALFSGSE
jgi:hypothetical protein